MKTKKICLDTFINLFEKFVSHKTWTKEKHKRYDELQQYLEKHNPVTIRVKPNSKYNHCLGAHSFTIKKVPSNQLGKLYGLRNKWVLIRCVASNGGGGWGEYCNEAYLLDTRPDNSKIEAIENRFKMYFVV